MLWVLGLVTLEKIINKSLSLDPVMQTQMLSLSGKVLRLSMAQPNMVFDTFFNETHIRFEPVSQSPFESKEMTAFQLPDCQVNVENIQHLMALLQQTDGNLPIEGDYKVLMQVKHLLTNFKPDILQALQPILGVSLTSQLQQIFAKLADFMPNQSNMADKFHSSHQMADDVQDLKQQLLKLRADVEREQARLQAIQAQQAKLQGLESGHD